MDKSGHEESAPNLNLVERIKLFFMSPKLFYWLTV